MSLETPNTLGNKSVAAMQFLSHFQKTLRPVDIHLRLPLTFMVYVSVWLMG